MTSPPSGRPLRADAQRNRAKVLAAAEEVFAVQGTSASTEEVARKAGVGIGTVFRHFPTKESLLEAVLVALLERLAAEAEDLCAARRPRRRVLRLLLAGRRAGDGQAGRHRGAGGGGRRRPRRHRAGRARAEGGRRRAAPTRAGGRSRPRGRRSRRGHGTAGRDVLRGPAAPAPATTCCGSPSTACARATAGPPRRPPPRHEASSAGSPSRCRTVRDVTARVSTT
ncbi:TetR/AcrR family transcriptional regulator [Actinomadura madurae]|nr:helix-turn-helix domain-containing protein [Actinomadura madurae]MCP9976669.1 TetR/AcrR family transcriptional regulator [Actinomadura madurae]